MTRRLERDLIAAGESVVRVSPKLMADVRDSARTYGKSDPIDALAVARAALREPDLPVARLDGVERELRLLIDHREDLIAERTRIISRLRWHLHELDPGWLPPANIDRTSAFTAITAHLNTCGEDGLVLRLARRLVEYLQVMTLEINALTTEITERVTSCRALAASHRRLRPVDRRQDPWRNRSGAPVPLQRRLRPTQRHRTDTRMVVQQTAASVVAHGKSSTQRCTAPHRDDAGAHAPTRPRITGPPKSRRRRRNGSTTDPQTSTLRRRPDLGHDPALISAAWL